MSGYGSDLERGRGRTSEKQILEMDGDRIPSEAASGAGPVLIVEVGGAGRV